MAFGDNLTLLRKAKGLSQEQLAEALDLTRQTISKWELNQSTPDLDYLIQLSEYFGVSVDCLIKGEPGDAGPGETVGSVSEPSAPPPAKSGDWQVWCFYAGLAGFLIAAVGLFALVLSSALHPWTFITLRHTYEGLLGFLLGTHTLWFFILLAVLGLLGAGAMVFGIVKEKKRTGK